MPLPPIMFAKLLMRPSCISSETVQDQNPYGTPFLAQPPKNYFKLNINGTMSSNSGKIGAGGVLRDHLGSWVDGFQINLGTGEILDAEACGLFFGLKLVFKHSIVNHEIKSDSTVLVQLIIQSLITFALAKDSINHDLDLITFADVSAHAAQAVLDDLAGVTRARRT
ncbi:hypothetical protein ACLB2K_050809 [Fragaria x ananassa]